MMMRGELHLGFGRRAVAGAAADRFGEGGDDALIGVPDDHRAVAADVIDVVVAVDIGDEAALGLADEQRRPADGFEGADGRADARRASPFGLVGTRLRNWR